VEDRLLPLKQTVRHPLDPPLPLHVDVVGPVHHQLGCRGGRPGVAQPRCLV
jgi:hypothetical protein